ncbi:hypothetical protein CRYUN_Cryun20dG0039100 [Craigia yunnanensis]
MATDHRRKKVVSRWRSTLFTVCVDNLSHRVPKGALWDVFYEKIDGRYIRVKKATYGWKERRSYAKRWTKKNVEAVMDGKIQNAFRDNRT